ncbi:carboxylesterase family protein [Staphylococcus simulans]
MTSITRQTKAGTIIGNRDQHCETYFGIPYAYPPLHERRFKHAKLCTHWPEPLNAEHFQAVPPQPFNKLEAFFSSNPKDTQVPKIENQSEDCLYLNIWKPITATKNETLPVMIWFYGGGYVNGHGSAELYNPKAFAEHAQVIVITFNYRLGVLGYLNFNAINDDYAMNCGLSDQLAVLLWVNHFIEDFGGDQHNITLCGQSAGAMSIQALMHLKAAQPLFHKAVLMSGTLRFDSIQHSASKAHHFMATVQNLYGTTDIGALSTRQIMHAMTNDLAQYGPSKGLELIYSPIFDETIMLDTPPDKWPVLVGFTEQEGDCYIRNESRKLTPERFLHIMKNNHILIDTDKFDITIGKGQSEAITYYEFKQPALRWLDAYACAHKWCYRFNWSAPTSFTFKTPYHILDVVFWFGHTDILQAHHLSITHPTQSLMEHMMETLKMFVTKGYVNWPVYTSIEDITTFE